MLNQSSARRRLAILALGASGTLAFAQSTHQSVSVPAAQLHFAETGVGRLQAAAGFGHMADGPHGTFVKLPAGYSTPLHRHSGDYYGVVIQGVVANEQNATAKNRPLGPGSYWYQKGGEDHLTRCLSKVECVTFLSQSEKFDFIPAQ
jgi:hypothetical protein